MAFPTKTLLHEYNLLSWSNNIPNLSIILSLILVQFLGGMPSHSRASFSVKNDRCHQSGGFPCSCLLLFGSFVSPTYFMINFLIKITVQNCIIVKMYDIHLSSSSNHQRLDMFSLLLAQHHDNWGNLLGTFCFPWMAYKSNLICVLRDHRWIEHFCLHNTKP